jgi:uncharacterized protein
MSAGTRGTVTKSWSGFWGSRFARRLGLGRIGPTLGIIISRICNLKGGAPGFARVIAPDVLAFPDYDGNGMFLSLGNIVANPHVGLLFINFERPKRLRVDGEACVSTDDPLIGCTVGAQLIGRVKARAIYPNCPRYIPKMQLIEPSIYAPRAGVDPPEPAWKGLPEFKDAVHKRHKPYRRANE